MGTFHTVAKEKQNGTYAANDITNQPQDLEQEEADAAKGKDAKDVKAETGGMSAGQVGIAAFKSTVVVGLCVGAPGIGMVAAAIFLYASRNWGVSKDQTKKELEESKKELEMLQIRDQMRERENRGLGKELDRRRAAQEGEQSLAAPEEGDPSQAPSSSLTHVAAALSQVGSEMMEDISQQRAALRTISAPTYEASLPSQRQVDQGGQPAPSGETRGSLSESHQIPETVGSVSALAPSQDVIYDNVSASAPVEDLENADSQPVYALATRDPEEVQRAADDRAGYIRVEGKGSGVFAGDELKKELMEAASLMAERRENKALSQELPFAPGDLPNVPSSGRDENTH